MKKEHALFFGIAAYLLCNYKLNVDNIGSKASEFIKNIQEMKELKYLGDLLKSKVEELSDKCQTTKDAILSKVYDIVHNYFKNNPPIDLRKNSTSANPSNIACLGAPASGKSSLNTDQDIKNKIQLCTDLYRTVFPEELAEKLKNKQSYQHTQDYAYVMKEFLVYAIKQQQSDQHAAIVYAGLSLSKDIQ